MTKFEWPTYIKFDDSEDDIKEARRVWLNSQEQPVPGEFLLFMQAYASEVQLRKERGTSNSQSCGA